MSRWHDDRGEVDYQYSRRGGGGGRGRSSRGPPAGRSFRDAEEFGWKRDRGNDRDFDRGYRRDRERSPPRGGPRGGPRGDRQAAPGCSVFVGNLSYRLHWQELKDHMRQAGDVAFVRIMEGPDGRSKGCGIVEYSNKRDAQRALDELHDSDLLGRPLMVREDREDGDGDVRERPSNRMREQGDRPPPREDRGSRGGGRGGGGGGGGDRGGRKERKERPPREEVTAEKLDEDLDSYFKAKPSKNAGEEAAAEEDAAAAGEDAGDALEEVVDAEEMAED